MIEKLDCKISISHYFRQLHTLPVRTLTKTYTYLSTTSISVFLHYVNHHIIMSQRHIKYVDCLELAMKLLV